MTGIVGEWGGGLLNGVTGGIDAPNLCSRPNPNRSITVADCRRVPKDTASSSSSREC